jgi:hypothetical protein
MDSEKTVTEHPRDVLRQVADSMNCRYNELSVTVPVHTTWKRAIQLAEATLSDIDESITLLPPLTGVGLRRRTLREFALRNNDSYDEKGQSGLPIRTNVDLSAIGPAPPISERHRGRLREIAKQIAKEEEESRQPYLTLHAGLTEGHLPVVKANLVLRGIDCESFEPVCGLRSTEMIWDTGAHRTIITEDILSAEFREHLAASIHDPYRSSDGLRVQVQADIALTNEILHINTMLL